jgi:orotate phosphoribosyltransferase
MRDTHYTSLGFPNDIEFTFKAIATEVAIGVATGVATKGVTCGVATATRL